MASAKNDTIINLFFPRLKPLVAIAGIIFCYFFVARLIFFSFFGYNLADKIFGVFLLLGETYILIHTMGYLLSIFRVSRHSLDVNLHELPLKNAPPVAVVVVSRHEPLEILENTLLSLQNLAYPNKNIYFLDDSSDPAFMFEADALGTRFKIPVFRRAARHGAKAGVLNDFIRGIKERYVAIFDADLSPVPDFLQKTVAIMEKDDNLAFVQAPQYSSNISRNPVASGAAAQQAIFYENVCERKSASNAMFCCGTNVVFRRDALLRVGGFDESSITEDFATSVKLHLKGYTSLFYGGVKAYGFSPETLGAYFKQQTRWAAGTVRIFAWLVKLFIKNPGSMSALQWWEYFLSGTYYFLGWAFFALMLCPIAYLLFGVPSFFERKEIYAAAFIPCFLLTFLVYYPSTREGRFRFKDFYHGTVLGLLGFPILMKSALYGILGKKMAFEVTAKGRAERMPWASLWPWYVMAGVNIAALYAGFRLLSGSGLNAAIAVNMAWAAYHLFVIMNIFYFNKPSGGAMEPAVEPETVIEGLEAGRFDLTGYK